MDSDWPPSDDDPFDFDTGEQGSRRSPDDPYDTGEYGRRRRSGREADPPSAEPPLPREGAPPADDPFEIPELDPDAPSTPPPRAPREPGFPPEPYEDPFVDTGEARRRAAERGDPFDTSEYRARRGARPRHRDLPAAVRRRQIFGVAGLAAAALIALYLLAFSGGGGGGGEEGTPVKKLVGQTIVSTLGEDGVDAKLLKRVQKGQLGGVIVTQDNPLESEVQSDISKIQKAARQGGNPPVLVMADQEGGFVKLLPGPPDLGPEDIAQEGPEAAQAEGQKTGAYLRPLGINVDLAPVLDVAHENTTDTILSRTFSDDPAEVGELGAAFVTGLQSARVAATAKHFPGMGLATNNTDFDDVSVTSTKDELAADIEPFRQAVAAGTDMVMVSVAVYPDLSGNRSAAFSKNVVQNELRGKLGFQGVIITDDLEAPGSSAVSGGAGAVQALDAGCDLALFARSEGNSAKGFTAVVKAVKGGRLDEATIQSAYDHIVALKQKLGA